MSLKTRVAKLEDRHDNPQQGYWYCPLAYFYGDPNAKPIYADHPLTLEEFYREPAKCNDVD